MTTGQPFFSEGFWAEGFWSDGFWGDQPQMLASLGAYGPIKRKAKRTDDDLETIEESLPVDVISRLRDETLAASVMAVAIKQAKRRRNEAVLLLMM